MSESVWTNFPGTGYGIVEGAPVAWVGAKRVGDVLDYTIDISGSVDPTADVIVGVTGQCAPSGTGELQLNQITVVGYLISLFLAGGQPSRTYTIPIIVTMANNRVFEFLAKVTITPNRTGDVPQVVPSEAYGPIVNAILSPPPSPGYAAGIGAAAAVGSSLAVAVGLASGTGAAGGIS